MEEKHFIFENERSSMFPNQGIGFILVNLRTRIIDNENTFHSFDSNEPVTPIAIEMY